ncbi:MAG TPA: chemotaxis protein CheB [Usitatibacter sp.]|jgi:two-component system chemotaxis response regulator CheB|nr:chemotaxis protein CheB [Usitatibacter sp.]
MKAGTKVDAVAVGGSAGGLEAVSMLLEALPERFVPSVLVVLHIPADKPSLLADLFDQRCRLPVREAMDKERLEAGTVYVAPPDYHLMVEDRNTLALSREAPVLFSRPSIDVLFESAADAFGDALTAIVVSGANEDGAQGLAAVRKAGGRAWVQSPSEAYAATMPAAAIERAGADLVAPIRDLAERLVHLRTGRVIAI